MIAAPVTGVKTEEPKEEPQAEIKDKSYAYGTDAYRHTDVIIPRTDKAPDGTPFTVTMSFDASAVVRLHRMMKENGDSMGLPHITINDMILFAVSKHLKKNKALNAHFLGDKIRYFDGVHLGFVVDTGHGMETPTVFDADRLSLASLSKITGALVRGARAGNVSPEKNKLCASFMVSNLGMLGVEAFNPVLQAPQTGILGVSALQKRLKEVNGQDISYPAIPLSLTFDPRAIDTTGAVKFLSSLCSALENFELLLIK
jgi:pyruvate dehydrogenase E2 component (dihydrolipoamide acetyltransferase)